MRNFFIYIFIFFNFQGCVVLEYPDYYKLKYVLSTKITDFKTPTEKLLFKMNDNLLYIGPHIIDKYIYVVDFMNVKNLKLTSQLGLFLSSEIKSNITSFYGFKVKELEYMKYFKIDESGTKLLSRNRDDILNNFEKTYALVGTYAITQRQLILYLKLIDMNTGIIMATTSESIEITEEIIEMEKTYKKEISTRPHLVL